MENIKRIHFLGIGGISQSALAIIYKNLGYIVSGSDIIKSAVTEKLEKQGIKISYSGVSKNIKKADLIIASAAIHDDDKEVVFAKKLGVPIISRATALGKVAEMFDNVISVSGSHGKTTTTGMISQIFIEAGLNPTVHIGGEFNEIGGNVLVGENKFFITEACEYVDSFLSLKSDVSVILNVQKDHMDYFKTFLNIKKSFKKFANNTKQNGIVVVNGDDKFAYSKFNKNHICFSTNKKGEIYAENIKEYSKGKYEFDAYFSSKKLGHFKLGVYGKHNVYNALASISVALFYNIKVKDIKNALYKFSGVKRRFEQIENNKQVKIIHDYAHHPTEIKATISLAREITKGKLFVVFQPHTYSRTLALLDEFKKCFKQTDYLYLFKVYPAREDKSAGIDEKGLAKEIENYNQNVECFDDYEKLKEKINYKIKKGDTLLILGAGDIVNFVDFYVHN